MFEGKRDVTVGAGSEMCKLRKRGIIKNYYGGLRKGKEPLTLSQLMLHNELFAQMEDSQKH